METSIAYVAGRTNDWREVREIQEILKTQGWAISYDWTKFVEGAGDLNERDGSLTEAVMAEQAGKDLDGCTEGCSAFVLYCKDDMHDAMGCYIELGAALLWNRIETIDYGVDANLIDIQVIAPPRHSIFFNLPHVKVFESLEQWKEQYA